MPGLPVDVGIGTTVEFGTTGFQGEITEVRIAGLTRASIPTSHMGTPEVPPDSVGNMTFIPSKLTDPGMLELTMHFNPNQRAPIDRLTEVITVRWPKAPADLTSAKFVGNGFCTTFNITAQLETVMVANVTVKFSGNCKYTNAT